MKKKKKIVQCHTFRKFKVLRGEKRKKSKKIVNNLYDDDDDDDDGGGGDGDGDGDGDTIRRRLVILGSSFRYAPTRDRCRLLKKKIRRVEICRRSRETRTQQVQERKRYENCARTSVPFGAVNFGLLTRLGTSR